MNEEKAALIELDEFELWRDRGDEAPLIIRGEARIPKDAAGGDMPWVQGLRALLLLPLSR